MRYIISLAISLILISGSLLAQNREDNEPCCEQSEQPTDNKQKNEEQKRTHQEMREMIQAKKIAFFTEYLDLTPSEAEKFWPLYNSFWKQRMDAHKNAKIAGFNNKVSYGEIYIIK